MAATLACAALQNRARASRRADPVTQAVRTALIPGAAAASKAAQWWAQTTEGLAEGPRLKAQNEALRRKLGAMAIYASEADDTARQLRGLKALVGAPYGPGRERVYGQVIALQPYEHRLTLDIGSRKGVRPDLAVVGGEGLAGVVESVSRESCVVLLITSAWARVGARVAREAPAFGIVQGVTRDSLTMEIAATSPVDVGDKVVTSGNSEWIPGGIPIGEVTQVTPRPEFGTKQLGIFPSLRIGGGRSLAVLK